MEMNLSTFMIHYLKVLNLVQKNYYHLNENDRKILDYEQQICELAENKTWSEDAIQKACELRYNAIMKNIGERYYNYKERGKWDSDLELDRSILMSLGIDKDPPLVLYISQRIEPAERFVFVSLVDYDGPHDKCGRSRYETFYGDGNAKTAQEFLAQAKETFEDPGYCEVTSISQIYENKAKTILEYNGHYYVYDI